MSGAIDIASLGHDCIGAMRLKRLQFAAERAPPQLAAEIYARIFKEAARESHPPFAIVNECLIAARDRTDGVTVTGIDMDWLARQEKLFGDRLRACESELVAAKRDGDRELIFRALYAFATLHYDSGDHIGALSKYLECKEWSGSSREIINVAMRIIKCSILIGNMAHVKTQAMRLRATIEHQKVTGAGTTSGSGVDNAVLLAEIDASVGLVSLRNGSFRAAAQSFLTVNSALGNHFNDIVTLRDCAIYAAVCALATFSRAELRSQLLSNGEWRSNIETVPQWREIVESYIDSDYQKCFDLIQTQSNLLLTFDRFIAAHMSKLIKDIRSRALIQQFQPYAALPLDQLAQQLGLERNELERSIAESINAGELNARIDTAHALLIKKDHAGRAIGQQKALALGEQFLRETRNSLLRMSLIENDLAVNLPKKLKHGER